MPLIALLILMARALSADPAIPVRLVPDRPLSGVLRPGQSRIYEVQCPGKIAVELEQGNADFALESIGDRGEVLAETNAFDYGVETGTGFPGVGRLRIRRVDSDATPASYTLTIRKFAESALDGLPLRRQAELASTAARKIGRATAEARQRAVEAARKSSGLWEELGDQDAAIRAALQFADSMFAVGSFDQAITLYSRTLERSPSPRVVAEAKANRGSAYWRKGMFSEALTDMNGSLSIWKTALPVHAGLGAVLSNAGLLSWEVGNYRAAGEYLSEAGRVLSALSSRRGLAFVSNNLALVWSSLGRYHESARSFEKAAELFTELGDKLASGRALTNSARIYLRLHQFQRSEANVRRGLALVEESGDQRAIAEGRTFAGEVCTATGKREEGLAYFRRARELAHKIGELRTEANALTSTGRALVQTPGRASGIAFLEDALRIWRRIGSPATESSVLYYLAMARRDSDDLQRATEAIDSALSIVEKLRGNVAAEDLRISFLASIHDFYTAAVDIHMRLGHTSKAWELAERGKARVLAEAIWNGHSTREDPSGEEEQRLQQQLNVETVRLVRDPQTAEQSRRRIDGLSAELSDLQDRIALSRGSVDAPGEPRTVTVTDVQRELLDDNTAILEFAPADAGGYAWLIRRDAIRSFRLPPMKLLGTYVSKIASVMAEGDMRARSADSDQDFRRAARSLSAALIAPALPNLPGKRLVIIPDGALQAVPFEALPLNPTGLALIDRFEVVEAPSVGVLIALRRRHGEGRTPSQSLAIVADGVFDPTDGRIVAPSNAPSRSSRFSRLVFSLREARSVAALAPGGGATLLLGFDATKQALTEGRLNDYRVLHISTHSTTQERPFLVLSLFNRDGSARDGMLSADEVMGLDLRAELVVLSACQTSVGRSVRGEGTLSMARFFMYAGAERLIAARWAADDEATSILFQHFYRALWGSPELSPGAALRRAQIALRSEQRWRSPFYWAAFSLHGAP